MQLRQRATHGQARRHRAPATRPTRDPQGPTRVRGRDPGRDLGQGRDLTLGILAPARGPTLAPHHGLALGRYRPGQTEDAVADRLPQSAVAVAAPAPALGPVLNMNHPPRHQRLQDEVVAHRVVPDPSPSPGRGRGRNPGLCLRSSSEGRHEVAVRGDAAGLVAAPSRTTPAPAPPLQAVRGAPRGHRRLVVIVRGGAPPAACPAGRGRGRPRGTCRTRGLAPARPQGHGLLRPRRGGRRRETPPVIGGERDLRRLTHPGVPKGGTREPGSDIRKALSESNGGCL